jgi:hypothetical protein
MAPITLGVRHPYTNNCCKISFVNIKPVLLLKMMKYFFMNILNFNYCCRCLSVIPVSGAMTFFQQTTNLNVPCTV